MNSGDEPAPVQAGHHDAHDYAERIRTQLPGRFQEMREDVNLSLEALWLKSGVSP